MSERRLRIAGLAAALSMAAWAGGAAAVEPAVNAPSVAEAALRDRLFARLEGARTEAEGREIENAIRHMWLAEAPHLVAADIEAAMDARSSYDLDGALSLLNSVVAAAPDCAEGWNQRAFIHFLKGDYDAALEDLDRTIALEPKHFAALSGKALTLMRQGRMALGQQALREAVAIHPWLRERSMLLPVPDEPPPTPEGRDI